MWIPPEIKDPVCRHAPTRKAVSYFGAVRLRDGKLCASKPEGYFDAQTCWKFFRKPPRVRVRYGRPVFLVIDNARYPHGKRHGEERSEPEPNFVLQFLPQYSPEL